MRSEAAADKVQERMDGSLDYSVAQWFAFFFIYSFLGWCFESAYVSVKKRRFVNRGFLRETFLPIYGSGAVMMLVASAPFQGLGAPQKYIYTYLAGCVGATVLEYVTGVVMEALFKVRYWDYSNRPFNFHGHICLESTLAWGGFTILMTEVIHRPIEQAVFSVPGRVLEVVTFVLTMCFAADFALSFKAAMDLQEALAGLEQVKREMSHMQKRLDVLIALTGEELEKVKEELAELREKYRIRGIDRERMSRIRDLFQRDMLRSNPTMISVKFGEALKELQEKLDQE